MSSVMQHPPSFFSEKKGFDNYCSRLVIGYEYYLNFLVNMVVEVP